MKKWVLLLLGFAVLSCIFYFQLEVWQSKIVGFLFGGLSLLLLGGIWKKIYADILSKEESFSYRLLGYATPFLLWGLFSGIGNTFWVANSVVLTLSFFLTAIISMAIFFRVHTKKEEILDIYSLEFPSLSPPGMLPGIYIFFFLLTLIGIAIPSTQSLQTPWQQLPVFFLFLFFGLTFILAYLIFSQKKVSFLLFFVVLHSLLLHSYIPLSHRLPWGGDVWRTIGVEEKFVQGEPLLPVLFGGEVKWKKFGPLSLPEAFTIPNKYIYSHLWGETVFLSRMLSVDLISMNRFLVTLVWGLLMPVLFYGIGKKLFSSEKQALFFSFFTFLPFSLQALGGLTVAVSWGMIIFVFLLFLWLEYLENKNPHLRNLALFWGALSLFGYTLFFFLFWWVVITSFVLKKIQNKNIRTSVWIGWSIMSIFFFPLLELVTKVNKMPEHFLWWRALKQFGGEWSGWFYASLIRSHDIASGNVIFNHTPSYSFVENIFNFQRVHLMVLMLILFVCVVRALLFCFQEKNIAWKVMGGLLVSTFVGYSISWYLLEGERSFTRRLDPVLAFLLILLASQGLFLFAENLKKKKQSTAFAVIGIFFLSLSMTTVYASGPDLHVVNEDEFTVAKQIARQPMEHPCVVADTWLLLALEGVSKARVVGGGFPVDASFGQKERVQLYEEVLSGDTSHLSAGAEALTKATECFVVVPKNSKNIAKISKKLGKPGFQNQSLLVWKIGLKKNPE